jgi:hypothetical protein
MYHPAAAFRQQALRETLQVDMTGIPAALEAARRARPSEPAPEHTAPGPAARVLTAADHMTRTPEPLENPVPAIAEMNDDQLILFR